MFQIGEKESMVWNSEFLKKERITFKNSKLSDFLRSVKKFP